MIARGSVDVTFKDVDATRIPDALVEGASLLVDLHARGVVDEVAEKVRIRRQGGYSGLDIWVTLVLYMAMDADVGVRKFWEVAQAHAVGLAALAGRKRIPSPASLSRALDAVEPELLREHAPWLLTGLADVDTVMRHPAMRTYDACGEAWHVFDLDPTVKTLRHRALPQGDDLPEPRRTSEDTAAPGHAGRKRGEVQFRRTTVQHAGSGVWTHAHLSPGNGDGRADFEAALDSVVATCARLDVPLSRTLVRMDGEYGNVPWFTACRERGLPFITRLNRRALYDDPEVLGRLRTADWYMVSDSRSGPQRSATDLGMFTVRADSKTKRADGTPYEPVTMRIIASRYPRSEPANRGRVLDGWQVELFAFDVDAGQWSSADGVAQFFGRAAEENRFAQEDRELGLDRIVSYHLPGQELASLVGLSLWNLAIAEGFARDTPPAVVPVQKLREPVRDDRAHAQWPRDPVISKLLGALHWEDLLARRPGWAFDANTAELRCEEGRSLTLTTVRPEPHADGRTGIIFCRPHGGCEACDVRPGCLRSDRPHAAKHVELSVPTADAERLRARLALVRGKTDAVAKVPIEPVRGTTGALDVVDALFLPARARQRFHAIFRGATLHVEVELPPPPRPRPTLVAADVGDRQRRRATWEQNVARYALPEGARVRIEVEASSEVRRLFGEVKSVRVPGGGSC